MAITLLTGGGLAIHTLFGLANRDLGFRKDHLLTFMLPIDANRFNTAAEIATGYRQLLERIQTLPAVITACVSVDIPIQGRIRIPFSIVAQPEVDPSRQPFARFNMVSASYFHAFGIPILRGRGVY